MLLSVWTKRHCILNYKLSYNIISKLLKIKFSFLDQVERTVRLTGVSYVTPQTQPGSVDGPPGRQRVGEVHLLDWDRG